MAEEEAEAERIGEIYPKSLAFVATKKGTLHIPVQIGY